VSYTLGVSSGDGIAAGAEPAAIRDLDQASFAADSVGLSSNIYGYSVRRSQFVPTLLQVPGRLTTSTIPVSSRSRHLGRQRLDGCSSNQ